MEQKVEFIHKWLTGKYTITELCRSFNISRSTAYKLISQYEKIGLSGLIEQEKVPINHPNRIHHKVEDSILKLKNKHLLWGANKIRVLSLEQYPEELIPSVVTVHNTLSENALVKLQKRSRRVKPVFPFPTLRSVMRFGAQTIKESF
jgi:transposase-like protein